MKTILILFLILISNVYSKLDTLSRWDKNSTKITAYNSTWAFARFDLEKPTRILNIEAYFIGTGTAQIVLLGQNAGSALPEVFSATNGAKFDAIWQNISINAPQNKLQKVILNIENSKEYRNNQIFIGVSCSQGLYLATDGISQLPTCESSSGGYYYAQQLITTNGWSLGNQGFLIDVIVDIDEDLPDNKFKIVNEERNLPLDLSSQGISWADIDNNGFQDLIAQGKIYYNDNGDFTEFDLGSGSSAHQVIIDIDNDNDLDILMLKVSDNKSKLLLNNGNSEFSESEINLPDLAGLSSVSVMDLNDDNLPDLFIGQLWKGYPIAQPNYLLYNDGNLGFIDNSKELYPEHNGYYNFPNGDSVYSNENNAIIAYSKNSHSRGSQFVDFDDDGDYDLYVTNYFLGEDEFYENLGNGTWKNITKEKYIDHNAYTSQGKTYIGSNHGTGVDWWDYDNDGDMDLLLPQFAHPRFLIYDHRGTTIYKNHGAPYFDFEDTYNPERWESSLGFEYEETHSGAAWGDYNNDGLADFVITTFYGCRFIDIYLQQEDGTFKNDSWSCGLQKTVTGVDAVWVDYDNDGDLDLCVGEDGKFRLRENQNNNTNNWLEIDLIATNINKYALGTKVKVFAGGKTYYQQLSNMRGQNMQRPYRLHFGLKNIKKIEKIQVEWEKGDLEEFYNIESNNIITITQGTGTVSVENSDKIEISIFPNPVVKNAILSLDKSIKGNIKISLIDLLGNEVKVFNILNNNNNVYDLNFSGITSGKYLLKIENNNQIFTKKISVLK